MMNLVEIVDIKNIPPIPSVYFIFDKNNIVYIGQSKNLNKRISTHNIFTKINKYDVCIKYFECNSKKHRLKIEAEYIKKYKPIYNINHLFDKKNIWTRINNETMNNIEISAKKNKISTHEMIRHIVEEYFRGR